MMRGKACSFLISRDRIITSLFAWLRENIHCHGMRYHPRDLVEKITGSTPGTEPFLDYLRVKYSKLYDF